MRPPGSPHAPSGDPDAAEEEATGENPAADLAAAALALLAVDPVGLGGLVLRSRAGPARDAFLAATAEIPLPRRRLHPSVEAEALHGGIDPVGSIAEGRLVRRPGLLDAPGLIVLTMAERTPPALAVALAAAAGRTHCVLALDEGASPEEGVPDALGESLGLGLVLDVDRPRGPRPPDLYAARARLSAVVASDETIAGLTAAAAAMAIPSMRAPVLALRAARAHAAWRGRTVVEAADLEAAAALVLAPRARAMPEPPPPAKEEPPPSEEAAGEGEAEGAPGADRLVEAVRAALPPGLLEALMAGRRRGAGAQGGAGARREGRRGRPLPSRAGRPSEGRVDAGATLRAAAPWQRMRRAALPRPSPERPLLLRPSDIRVRRHESRSERLVILVVDASGSAAAARLAEAKGVAEGLLARAYAARDHVALVTFRGRGAEIALPPTRSLARARRLLAGLPGGGGTPLAAGLLAARSLSEQARGRGQTPAIAILTDGRANVTLAGAGSREAASAEVETLARSFRDAGPTVVVDTATRPGRARALATALDAEWMALPRSGDLSSAVRTALA